ncbi:DNA-binding transcriptional regulator, LysR family [Lachnospiraceae bacterium]|nr:DNA-binding transcriptional regulator, LysR family [Lachnospiraceae bacterium]
MDNARYKAFVLAVESGSIRNAAEVLGYTSSAVSQLIQTLEKELDTTLLIRGKNGVSLTTSGEKLLPIIQRILSDEEKLRETAAGLKGVILGTINVASYHSLSYTCMPDIISSFQKKYPDVQINLYVGTQDNIVERLVSGKADIAFFNDSSMKEKHDWIPLMDDPMVAVVPKDHPMADAEVFPVKCFEGERFIMSDHGYDYDIMHILRQSGVSPNITISTFDSYALMSMVERGMGVSITNSIGLNTGENQGKIRVIPLEPSYILHMGMAVRSLKTASPAVLKFIECAELMVKMH